MTPQEYAIKALREGALQIGAIAFGDTEAAEKHRKAAEEFARGARKSAEAAKRITEDSK